MSDVRRIYGTKQLTIPAGSSLSTEPLDMRRVSGGIIEMDTVWDAANIGFKVSSGSVASDALLLYDNNATLVQITSPSVSKAFEMPVNVFGSHYIWIFSQSSGTAVDQSSSVEFTIQLKS